LAFCLCASFIQACATTSSQAEKAEPSSILIEGIVIRNELLFPVTDVMITVAESGAFAGCGNIMPRSDCRIGFEAVNYAGNALVVSWKEYGKPHKTDEFDNDFAQDLDPRIPAWLEVVIFAMGQAGARLIQ
jgi:hypothetical protein